MMLSNQQGLGAFLALGTLLRVWALAEREQRAEGISQIREGLDAWRAVGNELLRPYLLSLLAEALATMRTLGSAGGRPSCIGSRGSCY
jgi:predicted ATPase